jgi:polygalacturonase
MNKKTGYFLSFIAFAVIALLVLSGKIADKAAFHNFKAKTKLSAPELASRVDVPDFPEKICDIRDYGAREGAREKSTKAINDAVADCHRKGGGKVLIPDGKWLSGAINLKSGVNLFLDEEAEIIFSTNLEDYLPVVFTRFQGMEFYNYSPLVYAKDCRDVAITGSGKLIGSGDSRADWTGEGSFQQARKKLYKMSREGVDPEERIFGDNFPGLRPSFIQFVNCKNVLLEGFTVENGPIWTIHPIYSENFTARRLNIDTWSGNTDGIVIDSSKNIVIEDCDFSTGDDAIAIKSGLEEDGWRIARPSENILIRNINVTKGNSGVSIGSEMSGGARNIFILESSFQNTRHGFRIKTTKSRGGFVENVWISDIEMVNIPSDAIDINFSYNSPLKTNISNEPSLKNIFIKNIYGSGVEKAVIKIDGLSSSQMENINFENIIFSSSKKAVNLKRAKNTSLKNVQVEIKEHPAFSFDDSKNIFIENSVCPAESDPCFGIKGGKSENITLKGIDFSGALQKIATSGRVAPDAVKIEN